MPAKHTTPAARSKRPEPPSDETVRTWLEQENENVQLGTLDVCAAFSISPRRLQWLDEQKIIVPAQLAHRRIYTLRLALMVGVVADLRRRGFSLRDIRPRMGSIEYTTSWYFSKTQFLVVSYRQVRAIANADEACRIMAVSANNSRLVDLQGIARLLYERLHTTP
jgi:DNA-binding transcriptional MerR regulator